MIIIKGIGVNFNRNYFKGMLLLSVYPYSRHIRKIRNVSRMRSILNQGIFLDLSFEFFYLKKANL